MKIVWSPLAIDRLLEIVDWIRLDRPEAAARLADGVFEAVARLERFPESGRKVPEFDRNDLRELIHEKYRIIYRSDGQRVEILTVRHSLLDLEDADIGA